LPAEAIELPAADSSDSITRRRPASGSKWPNSRRPANNNTSQASRKPSSGKYHSAAAIDANIGAAIAAADPRAEAGRAAASRDLTVAADFSTVAESLPAAADLLIAADLRQEHEPSSIREKAFQQQGRGRRISTAGHPTVM
jgi:hypothetical protein